MKPWLLLWFTLEASAALLPHGKDPSAWGQDGMTSVIGPHSPGDNAARFAQGTTWSLQYAEPLPRWRNLGWSGEFGESMRVGTAFTWQELDTLFREVEFAGALGIPVLAGWRSGLDYTVRAAWIPGVAAWGTKSFGFGNTFFYHDVVSLTLMTRWQTSVFRIPDALAVGVRMQPHTRYALEPELAIPNSGKPRFRLGQCLQMGALGICHAISWPGQNFAASVQVRQGHFEAGASQRRFSSCPVSSATFLNYAEKP